MLFRSTGPGKTELVGKAATIQRGGDYQVLHVYMIDSVKWRIRAAMSFRDLFAMAAACGKRAIISFLLSVLQWLNRNPRHPESF